MPPCSPDCLKRWRRNPGRLCPGGAACTLEPGSGLYVAPRGMIDNGPFFFRNPSEGVVSYVGIWLYSAVSYDQLVAQVIGAGTGGSLARLGVYADDGTTLPGALVLDGGTVSTDTTGFRAVTVALAVPADGLYWLAVVTQGAPASTPAYSAWNVTSTLTAANVGTTPPTGTRAYGGSETAAAVFGALPATAQAPIGFTTPQPFLQARVA